MNLPESWTGINPSGEARHAKMALLAGLLVTLLLIGASRAHFLWFHTLAELMAVVIGVALYVVASSSHVFTRNNFLLFLAQGFFWATCIDVVHTLSYSGMGLLADDNPNPATQLWLSARYLEAATLVLAPRYLAGRALPEWSFALFGAVAAGLVALVFLGGLPDAYVPGLGLTSFKVASEYLIIALLLLAGWRLRRRRALLDPGLHRLIVGVIALTVASEFVFTLYIDVYGMSNLIGHLTKLWAFGLLLVAVSRWMLARPFRLLSHSAGSFESVPLPVLLLNREGTVQACNHSARLQHPGGGVGRALHAVWHRGIPPEQCPICAALLRGEAFHGELHDDQNDRWAEVNLQPVRQEGQLHGFVCAQVDITDRKRSERARQDSETRLRAILDGAADAVSVIAPDGRFIYANKQAESLIGFSKAELLGMTVADVLAKEDLEKGQAALRSALETGHVRLEIMARHRDGRHIPAEANAVRLPDGSVYCSMRDMTERMQAARQLMQQGALLRRVIDSIPDLIFFKDPDSVYLGCNTAFERYFGHPEAAIVGKTDLDFVDRETAEFFRAKDREMLEGGVPRLNEEWVTYPDGRRALLETLKTPYFDDQHHLLGLIGISRDITERRETEQRAHANERRYRALFDHMLEGFAHCRLVYEQGQPADIIVLDGNANVAKLTGLTDVVGRRVSELIPGYRDTNRDLLNHFARVAESGEPERFESYVHGLGSWLQLSVYSFEKEHFMVVFDNITERKNYEAQLEHQATHDLLTGLANRNLLADRLEQALVFAHRAQRYVALMLLDLDRFKLVNDSMGHDAGDTLLREVAERLGRCVRPGDTVARLGGDEFMMVMSDMASDEDATAMARTILGAVERPILIGEREVVVTASLGVTLYPRDGDSASTLFKNADVAMYRAKDLGRNSFQFYAPEMNARMLERLELEVGLRRALEQGELVLFYQPQVELQRGRVIGAEALIRWRHPLLGMVSPAQFIPLAEETGLIVSIGAWVIDTACAQLKRWQEEALPEIRLAVNVSARQFQHEELVHVVQDALERHGVRPDQLELEVTESAVMRDPGRTAAILGELKKIGVSIALDDFGTGYSSLNYLKRFPIDKLKIDQSFVREVTTDPDDAAIALSVISLAHSLNRRVMAEGVETEAQLAFLRRHGCDQIQGFLFARPMPDEEITSLLASGRSLESVPEPVDKARRTLLIVDDEPNVLAALQRQLRPDDYRILTARSAEEGLELLALYEVQVVLSDQRMPGMTGADFLMRVKDLYPDTIRIVLSGYTDLNTVTEAINRGAIFKFLTKPWEGEQLREQIREAFRYHGVRLADPTRLPLAGSGT